MYIHTYTWTYICILFKGTSVNIVCEFITSTGVSEFISEVTTFFLPIDVVTHEVFVASSKYLRDLW